MDGWLLTLAEKMNRFEVECRERVLSFFEEYSEEATQALQVIFARPYEKDVVVLDFVMFSYDCFRDNMPIFTWPTTEGHGVYSDFECPLAKIRIKSFDWADEEVDDDFVDVSEQMKDVAGRWLRAIWLKAGGQSFGIPCRFTDHDDLAFCFEENAWVDNGRFIQQES